MLTSSIKCHILYWCKYIYFYSKSQACCFNSISVLPYIKNGNLILDYGCGLATISQGFNNFAKGIRIFGIDNDHNVLRKARDFNISKNKSSSSNFVVSDVSSIPFKSESFDIVFGNTILMQLSNPIKCIKELKRVLRPRVVIALREPDYSLDEYSYEGFTYKLWNVFCEMLLIERGNPYIGSELRNIIKLNGFKETVYRVIKKAMNSSDTYNNIFVNFANDAEFLNRAVNIGLIDEAERLSLSEKILAELKNPNFECKRAYCEIIARKN